LNIVTYNVNCRLSDADLARSDTFGPTLAALRQQDLLLLQELGSQYSHQNGQDLLPDHQLYSTTHQRFGRGKGAAIAIHKRLQHLQAGPPKIYDDLQMIHLQLRHLLPTPQGRVHVICCYLPWRNSAQLSQGPDLQTRHMALQQIVDGISASEPGSIVIIGGDLNAKLGAAQALSTRALGAVLDTTGSTYVVKTSPKPDGPCPSCNDNTCLSCVLAQTTDEPGYKLAHLCQASDLIPLTGITPDDSPALASYINKSGQDSARLDHFLVSPSTLQYIRGHKVQQSWRGSDHYPVQLVLSLQRAPPAAPGPGAASGAPPRRYDIIVPTDSPQVIKRYQELISLEETWAPLTQLASSVSPTPDALMQAFRDIIYRAAAAAGYRVKTITAGQVAPTPAPRTSSKFKVWHNARCKELQQQIRAMPSQSSDPVVQRQRHRLEQKYKLLVKKLLRKHRLEVGKQRLAEWRWDRNAFWRQYKRPGAHCPFTPHEVAAHFRAKMNSYAAPSSQTTPARVDREQIDVSSECPKKYEISNAILSMNGAAAGIDGIPLALLKPWSAAKDQGANEAANPYQVLLACVSQVAAALHAVFRSVSATGTVPTEWRSALLAPIHKGKGELSDISNYRPLSMPTVACRVWSAALNTKLVREAEKLLPDTFFGFRPDRACSDPLFILRHLHDMQRGKKGKIFAAAFMDLSGAYDSVDRDLLFCKLENCVGLTSHSLGLLRSLYTDNQCVVKCGRSYSHPFAVGCGLRQGCPLSTTLFNLFIHDLPSRIHTECRYTERVGRGEREALMGVRCSTAPSSQRATPLLLRDLDYADDITLLAEKPEHLQAIINCFCSYCTEHGLIVNPSKCEAMVFAGNARAWPGAAWHTVRADGTHVPLARVEKFKYLGVELHGTRHIKAVVQHRLSRMLAAQGAIQRRLRELQATGDPQLIADLFETITAASGSYGCEVWCTPYLASWEAVAQCPLQRYQASVYKHSLGVKHGGTPNLPVFFEIGRYPMQIQWLSRTVGYWNKLVACKDRCTLLHDVFCANLHHGLGPEQVADRVECWSSELCRALEFVDSSRDWKGHMLSQYSIDRKHILQCARQSFSQILQQYSQDPGAADCPKRVHCMYAQWMLLQGEHNELPQPAYIAADMRADQKQAVAQLRLGAAPLRANLERGRPNYCERTCTRCNNHSAVDNERHALLECSALEDVRQCYAELLDGRNTLQELMATAYDPESVVQFVGFARDALRRIKTATGNQVGPRRGQGGLAG
jgi:exonuclease III